MSNETWRDRFVKRWLWLRTFSAIDVDKLIYDVEVEIEAAEKREREKAKKLINAGKNFYASVSGGIKECGHQFECICPSDKYKSALKEYEEAGE